MLENPDCRLCEMSNFVANPCLQGRGDVDSARLYVLLDMPQWMDDKRNKPMVSDGERLLLNLFGRMGVNVDEDVYFDYVVKCAAGKHLPKQKCDRLKCYEACSFYRFASLQNMPNIKAAVAMGAKTLEAINGSSELKEFEGECWGPREIPMKDKFHHVWVTYSPSYLIEKPAEIPNIYRILFTAAEEAGLNPKPDLTFPHFNWDEIE